jgi:hypothetical protein
MGEAKRRRSRDANKPNGGVFEEPLFRHAFERTSRLLDDPGIGDVQALASTISDRNKILDENTEVCARLGKAECGPGCTSCCHLLVTIAPFEAFAIARHLLETRTPAEIGQIRERLQRITAVPLDPGLRQKARIPCALLEADRCSIYEHRPSACRAALSQSRVACENCLAKGAGAIPAIEQPAQIDSFMQLGIDHALMTRRNLQVERVELSRAVLIALGDLEGTLQDWLEGRDPFADTHVRAPGEPSARASAEAAAKRFGMA